MPRAYATVGRAADNDVVLDDPTVSSHHARLSWSRGAVVVEDLSSANGTFVDGARVTKSRARVGADVRLGGVALPWGHEGLATFLKSGGGARTVAMAEVRRGGGVLRAVATGVLAALTLAVAAAAFLVWRRPWEEPPAVVADVRDSLESLATRQRIGGDTAEKLAKALTPMDALTRNTAAKIAARTEGPFHVEQVAEIWGAVRRQWKYVNDPAGREYFATATETIENGYVGDCDDFAIALVSMVTAIGGKARIVLMDGPRGGHAYAEACVHGEPKEVARALTRHYRNRWSKYLGGKAPSTIAYRADAECPLWLNLDWNSNVPGGAYEPEAWAVAIYESGRSATLSPAVPVDGGTAPPTPGAR